MRAITKNSLARALTKRLRLRSPRFVLHKYGGRLSGSIVDARFAGMGDLQRQMLIWDALEDAFAGQAARYVGTLLAYSDAEWDMPLEGHIKPRHRRAG
jgi:hypothetical protein